MFDPFGWASRYIPPVWLHLTIQASAIAIFITFLLKRGVEYPLFSLKPLWFVETLIYAVLIAAFVLRVQPVDRSRGLREIVVPLIGGTLPFALLLPPPNPAVWRNPIAINAVFWTMTLATALTIWGMWTLRRAFSITVEARELVSGGPYRFIRHPIYAGEMITAAAVACWRFSWTNLSLLALFIAIQITRSYWEERKLVRVFPAYAAHNARAWWFWRMKGSTT